MGPLVMGPYVGVRWTGPFPIAYKVQYFTLNCQWKCDIFLITDSTECKGAAYKPVWVDSLEKLNGVDV